MGWTFTRGYDKKDMVKELLTESDTRKVVAHSLRGSRLWVVFEMLMRDGETKKRVIAVYLLKKYRDEFGYKGIDETMGPCYYDCPKRFFDLVPDDAEYANAKWREQVRKQWTRAKAAKANPVVDGCKVRVRSGWKGAGEEFVAKLFKYRRRWYVNDGGFASLSYPKRAVERIA